MLSKQYGYGWNEYKCMPLFSLRAQTGTQELSWVPFWGCVCFCVHFCEGTYFEWFTLLKVCICFELSSVKGLVCCSGILCDQKKNQKLSFSKKAKFPALITRTHWLTDTIAGEKFHLNCVLQNRKVQPYFRRKVEVSCHKISFSDAGEFTAQQFKFNYTWVFIIGLWKL